MHIIPTRIQDVLLVEPDLHKDGRGFFLEAYHSKKYAEVGLRSLFVQDNRSRSVQGTLRGLHAQLRKPQGKLIQVVQGEIFDVAVDVRPDSHTFGQWVGQLLSSQNFHQLYIPPGFLHGFCVTGPFADVEYKCTDFYEAGDEVGVRWDDPDLKIQWPLSNPTLSEKDAALPGFQESKDRFEFFRTERLSKTS